MAKTKAKNLRYVCSRVEHGAVGKTVTLQGVQWRIAAVHANCAGGLWAWLCRKDKPQHQRRLSMAAPEFNHIT